VGFWVAPELEGVSGLVGGFSATVALGRETVGLLPSPGFVPPPGSGALAVLRAIVGAPTGEFEVASLIVGAPGRIVPPAVLRGIVGAGAGLGVVGAPEEGVDTMGTEGIGGFGGATAGGVGGFVGAVGGGVAGSVADGTAGGASEALRVTRTVSFFKGTLEVCLDIGSGALRVTRTVSFFKGTLEVCLDGGLFSFSFSLMRGGFFSEKKSNAIYPPSVKLASLKYGETGFLSAIRGLGKSPTVGLQIA